MVPGREGRGKPDGPGPGGAAGGCGGHECHSPGSRHSEGRTRTGTSGCSEHGLRNCSLWLLHQVRGAACPQVHPAPKGTPARASVGADEASRAPRGAARPRTGPKGRGGPAPTPKAGEAGSLGIQLAPCDQSRSRPRPRHPEVLLSPPHPSRPLPCLAGAGGPGPEPGARGALAGRGRPWSALCPHHHLLRPRCPVPLTVGLLSRARNELPIAWGLLRGCSCAPPQTVRRRTSSKPGTQSYKLPWDQTAPCPPPPLPSTRTQGPTPRPHPQGQAR